MCRSKLALPILAMTLIALVAVEPAEAQATRTWVSGVGDDVNPCSRTAPCKTFAGAISKTAAGGEINCLYSGGFGAVTITKSITIYCEGVIGGVLASGTNGIVVNAGAADIIVLRGLDIFGSGTGLNGIRFLAGAALHVENSAIRNFKGTGNGHGIQFVPSTAGAELHVTETLLTNNGAGTAGGGIVVQPSGSGSARVFLDRVWSLNNSSVGFRAESTAAATAVNVTITESSFASNGIHGIVANAAAGTGAVQLLIDRSSMANNGSAGIRADGSAATVRISNSNVSGNGLGSQITNAAVFQSYGTNRIDGNTNNGPNPTVIGQK